MTVGSANVYFSDASGVIAFGASRLSRYRPRKMSAETIDWYPPIAGWPATSSGYTSMSFTTQSESVPLVDAIRFTIGCPLILTGDVSTSETNATTSGRPDASRWSSTSHWRQVESGALMGRFGRARYGTGFAGIRDVFGERRVALAGCVETE